MAQVTSKKDNSVRQMNNAVMHLSKTVALESGDANSGDNIEVFDFPVDGQYQIVGAALKVDASLGAGVTLQLKANGTAITGATTAASASRVSADADSDMPIDIDGGETIELLVGGGNIGASANAVVDLFYVHRKRS